MEKKGFQNFLDNKLRNISFIIGNAFTFLAGLFFVLFIDLKVKIESETIIISAWLIFAIIFAVGGGIFFFVGDMVRHKKKQTVILKLVGIVFALAYIVFLQLFKFNVIPNSGLMSSTMATATNIVNASLIMSVIGIAGLSVNLSVYTDEDY